MVPAGARRDRASIVNIFFHINDFLNINFRCRWLQEETTSHIFPLLFFHESLETYVVPMLFMNNTDHNSISQFQSIFKSCNPIDNFFCCYWSMCEIVKFECLSKFDLLPMVPCRVLKSKPFQTKIDNPFKSKTAKTALVWICLTHFFNQPFN